MRDYYSLGDAIDRFLEKHKLKDDLLIQRILTDWSKYVGAPIANNTEKVWFEKGILFIKMSSPAWRNELMQARLKLLTMINKQAGKALVEEVRIL